MVVTPLNSCLQFCATHYPKHTEVLQHLQRRATQLVQEHKFNEDRLRQLRLFIVEKRILRRDLVALYSYLRGSYSQVGIDFLS